MVKSSRFPHTLTAISVLFLCCLFLLSGCEDNPFTDDFNEMPDANTVRIRDEAPRSETFLKLRHPQLLESARSQVAGKTSSADNVHLHLAYNEYEANGITPRILDNYGITTRILNEYGITRRVLDQHGITPRLLGTTPRILESYFITTRVLDQYGITPRVLEDYSNEITEALLAANSLTFESKAQWDNRKKKLVLQGKALVGEHSPNAIVVITNTNTGEVIVTLEAENDGDFQWQEQGLTIAPPCSVTATVGTRSEAFPVTGAPDECQ